MGVESLYIAKASCGEVRAQLSSALDQKYIETNKYNELTRRGRQISGMIFKLINYLKSSRFQGLKFKRKPQKSFSKEVKEFLNKYYKEP